MKAWQLAAAAAGAVFIAAAAAKGAHAMGATRTLGPGPTPTIRQGSTGEAVKRWQVFLGLPASGSFDAPTTAATSSWQAAHGLVADGIVGPRTWGTAMGLPSNHPGGPPGDAPVSASSHQVAPPDPLPYAPPPGGADSGRAWAQGLPANATADREAAIVAAVAAGFFRAPDVVAIDASKAGHTVTIYTWGDCLAIGLSDPIRVNVWHSTAQRLADRLGLCVGTSRMVDAAYLACPSKLNPQVMPADAKMATTARMVEHSDKVAAARARAGLGGGFGGFARDNGKDWVSTERLLAGGVVARPTHSTIGAGGGPTPAGANFGWHSDAAGLRSPKAPDGSTGGLAVFQSIGLAHDMNYTDYSQTCTLFRADCEVDGASRSVEEVLRDPALAWLLSDEVALGTACKVWRHPAIPPGG